MYISRDVIAESWLNNDNTLMFSKIVTNYYNFCWDTLTHVCSTLDIWKAHGAAVDMYAFM